MGKVIIDCDPGIDDSLALLLALQSPELEIAGISVVAGNVRVELGALNVQKVEVLLNKKVPVALGAAKPLLRPLKTGFSKHGADGLGDVFPYTPRSKCDPRPASEFIVDKVMGGEANRIIALGPLTNVATALLSEPTLGDSLRDLVIMGGGVRTEDTSNDKLDFNLSTDPEAAQMVLNSGVPIIMVGPNVTMTTIFPHSLTRRLMKEAQSPIGRFVGSVTDYYSRHYIDKYGIEGCVMHDPLAVGIAIDRTLVRTRHTFIRVETMDEMVLDRKGADRSERSQPRDSPNAEVAMDVDADRFLQMYVKRVIPEALPWLKQSE